MVILKTLSKHGENSKGQVTCEDYKSDFICKLSSGIGYFLKRHPPNDNDRYVVIYVQDRSLHVYIMGMINDYNIMVDESGQLYKCLWHKRYDDVSVFTDMTTDEKDAIGKLLLHEAHKFLKIKHFFWKIQYKRIFI